MTDAKTERPNILIIMVDQLTGTLFPDGPAGFLHTPNLRRLAQHALRLTELLCRLAALRTGTGVHHGGATAQPHPGL